MRVQNSTDPIETSNYWLGRHVWSSGSDVDGSIAANSFALKYGYGGQNFLGFTSAWGLSDATDEELLDAFDAPAFLRNDVTSRQQWLDFVRPNTHTNPPSVVTESGLPLQNNRWKQFSLPCEP